jgi:two-component system cell cycle sensor histidine kinase/response regulator CckA
MSETEVMELRAEIASLRARLWEAEDSLQAIRAGEVDALIFPTDGGEQVFVLRSADEPYRVLVEHLQEGAIIASARGEILYCNQQLGALVGLPLERLIGSLFLRYVAPEDQELAAGLLTNGRRTAQRAELSLVNAGGAARPVQLSVAPYDSAGAGALCIVATDLSEQRRGETLVADERLARSILEHVAEAVAVCGPDGRVLRANQEANRLAGSPVVGAPFPEVFPLQFPAVLQSAQELLRTALRGERLTMVEAVLPTRAGRPLTLLVSCGPLQDATPTVAGVVVTMVNITERKTVEERLRQSQRLESVGRLAGGVAHEVNNQMTVVLGFADILSSDATLPRGAREDIRQIHRAAVRSAAITAQLLAFSRKQILLPQVLDLNVVIRDFEPVLVQTLGPKNLHLELGLSGTPVVVLGDRGQLEQVLLNLVRNARDATPEGGKITVETGETVLDSDAFRAQEVAPRPGPYVVLTVRDTGCGMLPDVLAHIFEPFFTTKRTGEGTGLGLSTVYGIVKQSNGYVWASSEAGRGTTFEVYLPSSGAPQRPDAPAELPAAACRHDAVLIVDDEPGVRAMMSRALCDAGFVVMEAADGHEAIDLLQRRPEPPDAVITDMIMEGMTGKELARRIANEFPEIPVLFTSGSTDYDIAHLGSLDQDHRFLQKPFSAVDLVHRVRALIKDRVTRVDGNMARTGEHIPGHGI